jgi:hypothetical protein
VVRLTLVVLALAVPCVPAAASASGSTPFAARATTACLTAHRVLANSVPRTQVLPARYPSVAALQISFALIPAQSIDHGWIFFEKDPATASRVGAAWIAYLIKQAARVQGIDQSQAARVIRASVSVDRNAIVQWDNRPTKAASRRLVASCLR